MPTWILSSPRSWNSNRPSSGLRWLWFLFWTAFFCRPEQKPPAAPPSSADFIRLIAQLSKVSGGFFGQLLSKLASVQDLRPFLWMVLWVVEGDQAT
ncbi:MAG: hypothetical protein II479_07205, partial [Bacteroidales bacterium]|nr:hypothetical protein [Bacteroidales bacterium]